MQRIKWDFCKVRLSDLIEWNENPELMHVNEAEAVRESMEKFGVAEALVVNADRINLIGGSHRRRILIADEGADYEAWALYPDRQLTDEEAHELSIRLNGNRGRLDTESMLNLYEIEQIASFGVDITPYQMMIEPVRSPLPPEATRPPITRTRSGLRRLLLMLTPEQYDEISQRIQQATLEGRGEYEGNPNEDANAAYWLIMRDIDFTGDE